MIVEDDDDKRVQIAKFVSDELTDNFVEARSLQSSVRIIMKESFDLILLDMTMTNFDIAPIHQGGRPQSYAGKELLMQMVRRKIYYPVIVVTQFDIFESNGKKLTLEQLDMELEQQFPKVYWGAVHFNVKYDDWREKIKTLLNKQRANNV